MRLPVRPVVVRKDDDRERRRGALPLWYLLRRASTHPLWQVVASSETATVLLFSALVGGAAILTLQPASKERLSRIAGGKHYGVGGAPGAKGGGAGTVLEDDYRGDSVSFLHEANKGALGEPVAEGGDGAAGQAGSSSDPDYDGPAPYNPGAGAEGVQGADKDAAAAAGAAMDGAKLARLGFGGGGGGGAGFAGGGRLGSGGDPKQAGVGSAFSGAGRLTPSSRSLRAVTSRARIGRSAGSTRAFDQLRHADRLSRFGANQGVDTAARTAQTNAFETQPASAGQIVGAGPGLTGTGITPGSGEPVPSGPIGGTFQNPPPNIDASQDVTPWNGMLATARTLLLIADILLMWAAFFSAKKNTAAAKKLAAVATFLSLIVVGIGFGIYQQYGQQQQGAILMSAGGVVAAGAAAAMMVGKYTPVFYALAAATSGILLAISMRLQSVV